MREGFDRATWLLSLREGDKVARSVDHGNGWAILTIAVLTPTIIRIADSKTTFSREDGYVRGKRDTWDSSGNEIVPFTDAIRDEMERARLLDKARHMFRPETWTTEDLRAVVHISENYRLRAKEK